MLVFPHADLAVVEVALSDFDLSESSLVEDDGSAVSVHFEDAGVEEDFLAASADYGLSPVHQVVYGS